MWQDSAPAAPHHPSLPPPSAPPPPSPHPSSLSADTSLSRWTGQHTGPLCHLSVSPTGPRGASVAQPLLGFCPPPPSPPPLPFPCSPPSLTHPPRTAVARHFICPSECSAFPSLLQTPGPWRRTWIRHNQTGTGVQGVGLWL